MRRIPMGCSDLSRGETMRASLQRGGRRRGSAMVLFTIMLPTLLLPLVGLAIDGSRLYIVQAKLAGAVDGAALGAGRLLGTSADTVEIAGEFLNANFPAGFWGTQSYAEYYLYQDDHLKYHLGLGDG